MAACLFAQKSFKHQPPYSLLMAGFADSSTVLVFSVLVFSHAKLLWKPWLLRAIISMEGESLYHVGGHGPMAVY